MIILENKRSFVCVLVPCLKHFDCFPYHVRHNTENSLWSINLQSAVKITFLISKLKIPNLNLKKKITSENTIKHFVNNSVNRNLS